MSVADSAATGRPLTRLGPTRLGAVGGGLLVALLLAVACGGDEDATGSDAVTTSTAAGTTSTVAGSNVMVVEDVP